MRKQGDEFNAIESSLRQTLRSMRKQFIPIMGCGYGSVYSEPTPKRRFYKLAGQAFWAHVTGDKNFYIKMVQLMKDEPLKHRPIFEAAWDRAVNRFVRELTIDFCDVEGNILREKLTTFNSGYPKKMKKARSEQTAV
jgi:Type II restriction endonuclease EcoO109I